jgi:hypothetical protein
MFGYVLLSLMFSLSTKLEKRAEQVLPGSKRGGGKKEGAGGRNGLNNVCTCE